LPCLDSPHLDDWTTWRLVNIPLQLFNAGVQIISKTTDG
jgi:hypothetical protein